MWGKDFAPVLLEMVFDEFPPIRLDIHSDWQEDIAV
jgi:hypothetical protein